MLIRVGIADIQPIVRSGVKNELMHHPDFTIMGEADTGENALKLGLNPNIDILLLDLNLPGLKTLDVIKTMKSTSASCKAVILTAYRDAEMVFELLHAGAVGYILKKEPPQQISIALVKIMEGDLWLSKPIVKLLVRESNEKLDQAENLALTYREREVLIRLSNGSTNKGIAVDLQISESTVVFHLGNIYRKLAVTNRVEAALWAKEQGLI
jgi:DNA-binding NarL/FixJ family response regulator